MKGLPVTRSTMINWEYIASTCRNAIIGLGTGLAITSGMLDSLEQWIRISGGFLGLAVMVITIRNLLRKPK
jgi:hypothetical protein